MNTKSLIEGKLIRSPGLRTTVAMALAAWLSLPLAGLGAVPLEGMVLRLDAGALELEDGARVAQWPDVSGAGNHARQGDESRRPVFVAEGSPFGLPVVRFSAVSPFSHLRVENMGPHHPPNTIFLVWKINRNTGGDQQPLDGLTEASRVRIGYQANPSRLFAWSGGGFPNLEKAMTVPFQELIVTTAVFDSGGGLFKVDGVLEDQGATGSIPITGFTIGRRFTEAQALAGDIAEVIVYDRRLSESEINQVEDYLHVKWLTEEGVVPPGEPITITQQPRDLTVFEGQPATFSVEFDGTPPYRVQWQRNGQDIPAATDATYTFTAAPADSGAQFRVVVGNDFGDDQISETATLTVREESGLKIWVSFSGTGPEFVNDGNLGGAALLTASEGDGYPVVSANVPIGPQAPGGNDQSVDFGTISDGEGGRAIDFTNPFDNTLGTMEAFTVCVWLNARDLSVGGGGNRIAFALAAPDGPGFDLVHLADGSLQLGVNQWPDFTPARSSAGLLTADPEAAAANWVFVAVTYDGAADTGNVSFHAGNANQAAQVDLVADYPRGPIVESGSLTLGNFGAVVGARDHTGPGGGSRVFRGLIDELQVFNRVLSLAEIQRAQRAGDPVDEPQIEISASVAGAVVFSWEASSPFQLQARDDLTAGDWATVPIHPIVEGNRHTVTLPIEAGARYFRLRGL